MNEKLPINLSMLKYMRESLNLTIDEVAYKLKKDAEIYQKWESGEESPTYIQLEKIAHLYKRPIAVFFMSSIPYDVSPTVDFRAMPSEINNSLPAELILIYRKAKAMQCNLEEIFESSNSKNKLLSSFTDVNLDNYTEVASRLRNSLGVSIEQQIGWKNSETALQEWRKALDNEGIFVFKDAFKNSEYYGFCLYDEKYPIIYVNNTTTKTRQIFTLFHEFAHLLFKVSGIDLVDKGIFNLFDDKYRIIEVMCNKLAGEFLYPDSLFEKEFKSFSEEYVSELTVKYSVSRELVLRKYLDHNLIDKHTYSKFRDKWIKQINTKNPEGGGNYYFTQKAYLGENYINAVFQKYYRGSFSVDKLAEYLNIKVSSVSKMENLVLNGSL